MGMFQDYMEGIAMRKNPQLLQRKLQGMESDRMAQMADQIYGNRGQAAVPDQFNARPDGMPIEFGATPDVQGQEAQAGTGMFDESMSERDRMMLMNKRMLGSGISGFNKQWSQNQGNMQNSMMSQMGAMNRQKQNQQYDTANPTETSGMKEYQLYRQQGGTLPWYEYKKSLAKAGAVNLGSGDSRLNFASPGEVNQLGYAKGTQVLIDKNNKPYLPAGMNEQTSKNRSFLSMMDESEKIEDDIVTNNPDFDPSAPIDATLRSIQAGGGTIAQVIGKLQSPASKAYMTSQMNWIAANRGALSGAAVPEIEVERDLQTYYPQANDPANVKAYKKQLRVSRKEAIRSTLNMPAEARRKALKESADVDFDKIQGMKSPKPRYADKAKQARYEKFKAEQAK